MDDLTFLEKWARQADVFMEYVLVALVGGVLMACFSQNVRVRYLIGSVVFGAALGGSGQYFFANEAMPILMTIVGVITAPVTIAKLSGMTIWQAMDEIKKSHESGKN